jgi:hypothetical protein
MVAGWPQGEFIFTLVALRCLSAGPAGCWRSKRRRLISGVYAEVTVSRSSRLVFMVAGIYSARPAAAGFFAPDPEVCRRAAANCSGGWPRC